MLGITGPDRIVPSIGAASGLNRCIWQKTVSFSAPNRCIPNGTKIMHRSRCLVLSHQFRAELDIELMQSGQQRRESAVHRIGRALHT